MKDNIYICANSILGFLLEAFKKDSQVAVLLTKTTKLLPNMLTMFKQTLEDFMTDNLPLNSQNLVTLFLDRTIKLLHVSLLEPQDYVTEQLFRFLSERPLSKGAEGTRNWIYFVKMFEAVDKVTHKSSYYYGNYDIKLGFCRFISEFLLSLGKKDHYLDELIVDVEQWSEPDESAYGGLLFLHYGTVFKSLYFT